METLAAETFATLWLVLTLALMAAPVIVAATAGIIALAKRANRPPARNPYTWAIGEGRRNLHHPDPEWSAPRVGWTRHDLEWTRSNFPGATVAGLAWLDGRSDTVARAKQLATAGARVDELSAAVARFEALDHAADNCSRCGEARHSARFLYDDDGQPTGACSYIAHPGRGGSIPGPTLDG